MGMIHAFVTGIFVVFKLCTQHIHYLKVRDRFYILQDMNVFTNRSMLEHGILFYWSIFDQWKKQHIQGSRLFKLLVVSVPAHTKSPIQVFWRLMGSAWANKQYYCPFCKNAPTLQANKTGLWQLNKQCASSRFRYTHSSVRLNLIHIHFKDWCFVFLCKIIKGMLPPSLGSVRCEL